MKEEADMMLQVMLAGQKQELERVIDCNGKTERFGLSLTPEDAAQLMEARKNSLKSCERVEFGSCILPDLITAFCDSSYLRQDNYRDTLEALQEIFYMYKNETADELTDSELLLFMRQQFDDICFGDLEYLRTTCLERFARAIRAGYQTEMHKKARDEYEMHPAGNEYNRFAEEAGWDYELYSQMLKD
ncbi:DUF6323 family protein [Anaerolentibacter hominis]|uniref:DUF6323 family protein n=1 Tax=Anaerolentibacter hominis TaxID=3079009 RepID=UPI0031B81E2A